jgi:hypothetical protein
MGDALSVFADLNPIWTHPEIYAVEGWGQFVLARAGGNWALPGAMGSASLVLLSSSGTRPMKAAIGFAHPVATAHTADTVWYRTQPKSTLKRTFTPPTQTRILGVAPEMRVFLIVVPAIRSLAFTLPMLADIRMASAICRTQVAGVLVLRSQWIIAASLIDRCLGGFECNGLP